MDTKMAGQYKPSINIEQAPRLGAPLLYIGSAWVFAVLGAVTVWSQAGHVAAGEYGYPVVIMAVHFVTLGFLTMTAMGVLTQWIPVVFDVPALRPMRVAAHFLMYWLGIVGFALGIAASRWPIVATSGTLLAVAIVAWSLAVRGQTRRSEKPHDVLYWGVSGAVFSLNVVWVLGVFMALSFLGWWPEYRVLQVHVATALAGWLGLLILSVQLKLNPMFSMSRGEGLRPAIPVLFATAGVMAAWTSLWVGNRGIQVGGVLWTMAVVVTMWQSYRIIRTGRAETLDRVFYGVGAAWLMLLTAALLASTANPLAVMLAFWGMFTLILSYESRVIPFMAAVAVSRRMPGPIYKSFYMAQAMKPASQPIVVAVLGLVGAGLMTLGRLAGSGVLVQASAALAVVMVVSEVGQLALAMRRARQSRPSQP